MTFQSTIFGFMSSLCLGPAYFSEVFCCCCCCSHCNLQMVSIERELIKHTFLFCFLHCVNIVCVNITKRDPNNLSLSIFFSLGMCFHDMFFCVGKCHVTIALPSV